jgi:tripartite-type tricarboxylate transporter receptor subunit TctC
VVRSPPDGYTLLLAVAANAINAALYDKLNFNFIRDIAPVAGVSGTAWIMEVHPSLPVKTVPEFIAYAKVNPGKLNMASGGTGTLPHVAGELFKMLTGVEMRHVPYRGSPPAITDLLGGQGYARRCFPKCAHGMGAFAMPAYRKARSVSARKVPGEGRKAQ